MLATAPYSTQQRNYRLLQVEEGRKLGPLEKRIDFIWNKQKYTVHNFTGITQSQLFHYIETDMTLLRRKLG